MNIVISINRNYVFPFCVMLRSMLDANSDVAIFVYVLHSELTEDDFAYIKKVVPDGRYQLQGIKIEEAFLADAPISFHFTKEMYYRIFSARLLPDTLDRALYLDPDMIINRPLAPLYQLEMGNAFFAAARSINPIAQVEYRHRLEMPEKSEYFNSGVLLMNLAQLRISQDVDAAVTFIKTNRDKLLLPDQDVLNALYYDKTILLDPLLYNFDARYFQAVRMKSLNKYDLEWVRRNTVIIHYCGKSKPWNEHYLGELGVFYREAADRLQLP